MGDVLVDWARRIVALRASWRPGQRFLLDLGRRWACGSGMKTPSAIVIGAGLVGASVAFGLARRGWSVQVCERDDERCPGRGASWAAGGMLAPGAEVLEADVAPREGFGAHLASGLAALSFWRDWAKDVSMAAGQSLGVAWTGTRVHGVSDRLGRLGAWPSEIASDGSVFLPEEGHVDPIEVLTVARAACRAVGVAFMHQAQVHGVEPACSVTGKSAAVVLWGAHAGAPSMRLAADAIVVTAGWQSRGFSALYGGLDEIRPVRGQMVELHLAAACDASQSVERAPGVYVIPRTGSDQKVERVVVGATVEPGVCHGGVEGQAIDGLIARACALNPRLSRARVGRAWSGVRPFAPQPLAGRIADGVFACTGHYRNGILLAPRAGEELAATMHGQSADMLACS